MAPLLLALVAMTASPSSGVTWSTVERDGSYQRQLVATAVGASPAQVRECHASPLGNVPGYLGVVTAVAQVEGRELAVVLPMMSCDRGVCVGAPLTYANARAAPKILIVDLLGPELALTRPALEAAAPSHPRWPALLVVLERREDRATSTELRILSLRAPRPEQLLNLQLEQRPDAGGGSSWSTLKLGAPDEIHPELQLEGTADSSAYPKRLPTRRTQHFKWDGQQLAPVLDWP